MKRLLLANVIIIFSLCMFGCSSKISSNNNSTFSGFHFVDDQTLAIKASLALRKDKEISKKGHISILAHKQAVLLVGQVPTLDLKIRTEKLVSEVSKVEKIFNQLSLKDPISFTQRAKDAWITTQVKAKLFTEPKLSSNNIKVVTEDKIVYLMGTPNGEDKEKAIDVVRNMKDIEQVVDVFNADDNN